MTHELVVPSTEIIAAPPPGFPGLIHGLDIDVYHSMAGISKTGLDRIEQSPAHYYGWHLDPQRPAQRERSGQLEGNLAHCAILEPGEFSARYVTIPAHAPRRPTEAQWNAKKPSEDSIAAMSWWTDFTARHSNKRVITAEQYEVAMRQAEAVRKLPEVVEALDRGRPEVSAFWVDAQTGALCRCRPDWVADFGGRRVILLDVKTYSNASAGEFRRQVARKRYHVQDAYYSDGYAAASGVDVMGFVFVAVEGEWPHQANALMLDEPGREQGRRDYRRNLDTFSTCMRSNHWPGYGERVQLIDLPSWALTD